jgi:hypothetical protein
MPRQPGRWLQRIAIAVSLILLGYWCVLASTAHVPWLYGLFALPAIVALLSLYMPERSAIRAVAVALGLLGASWWIVYAFAVQPYAFAWEQLIPLAFGISHLIAVAAMVHRSSNLTAGLIR